MQSFIYLLSRSLLNPCFGIKHPIVNKIAKVTLFTELSTSITGGASLRRHINEQTNSVLSNCLSAKKEQCPSQDMWDLCLYKQFVTPNQHGNTILATQSHMIP